MSRINTNVTSLLAQRVLNKNNNALSTSLERLSTGLKINRGSDNPAGLIASENLRAEKAGISQAVKNAERASNIIGTAEGGLSEVSALLTELQSLVTESANSGGLSDEEVNANQLQVDSILNTINRLAQGVEFQGKKLLDGSLSYTTSGVDSSQIANLRINSARISDGSELNVVVEVTTSAQTASVSYSGTAVSGNVTIEVAGNNGTEQLSFQDGAATSAIAAAVNAVKDATGVSATVSGGYLVFNSTEYGSEQYVTVRAVSGSFQVNTTTDYGRDAAVSINGANATAKGLSVSYRSSGLDVSFDLASSFNTAGTGSFYVTGGGATFNLSGKVTEGGKKSIGIDAITTGNLGNSTLGFLSSLATGSTNSLSSGNLTTSQKIVNKAIEQVSQLRGRLGAFQKFEIGATINSLGVTLENLSAAESSIRDTDFAEETASLTRSQILSQAAQSVLAQANAAPQAALSLLR